MAQASRAILPKDPGGPWGQRIGVTVAGSLDWGLRVGAYQTKRVSSTDWNRYSLVVLNWFVFTSNNQRLWLITSLTGTTALPLPSILYPSMQPLNSVGNR